MIFYVFLWLQVAPFSFAQDPNKPKCTDSSFDWTFNSLGQSPCYVAELLTDPCTGLTYSFVSLPSTNSAYTATNDPCFCNTVVYSMLSACAICQSGSFSEWKIYSRLCDQTYFMEYPGNIPSNTSVPNWAYTNVTASDGIFNCTAAYYLAFAPSSRHSTSFTSTSTSTSSTSTSASTSTESISPSSHSSRTNASAIIGVAIGCAFGGVLILALLLFWLYTKRGASRPDPETSPQTSEHKLTDPPPSTPLLPVPSPPASTDSPTPVQQAYQDALENTYDPDDVLTSSTIPRFRYEGPRGLLPNTEHHWGQVGQYYSDIPEL